MRAGRSIRSLLFCVFLGLFATPHALAQQFDVIALVPMPAIPVLITSYFEQKTDFYKEAPSGDETLSYNVRLPKGWEKSTDAGLRNYVLDSSIVGEVARYFSPPTLDKRSSFTVKALQLDYEISARNWFVNHILTNGYTLQGFIQINENKIDALYVLLEGEQSYVVRAAVELNGRRMVLAEYSVPYEMWHQEKSMQQACISSFGLLKPDRSLVEILDTYNFLDLIEFKYPISWSLRASAIRSIDQMGVTLVNATKGGQMNGFIDIGVMSVDVVGMDPTKNESDFSKKMLEGIRSRTGFGIGEKIEDIAGYKVSPLIKSSAVRSFQAKDDTEKLLDYEIWIATMAEEDYKYYITMVTPARKDDFFVWARNAKAFERVVESISSSVSEQEPDYSRYKEYRDKKKQEALEKGKVSDKNPFFRSTP